MADLRVVDTVVTGVAEAYARNSGYSAEFLEKTLRVAIAHRNAGNRMSGLQALLLQHYEKALKRKR